MNIAVASEALPLVNSRYLAAALVALAVMIFAVLGPSLWLLDFLHVAFGVLWTGIDLFMGFVIGPIVRHMDLAARRQMITRLMPKMLFLMPTLAIGTGTTGWFLAERFGYLAQSGTRFSWVVAALVIVTVLTVQGLGVLLPINVKVFLELRKTQPDGERIGRLMRRYVRTVSAQGVLQIAIIVVMAHLRMG